MKEKPSKYASESQVLLAKLYRYVTRIGFSVIAVAFVLYVSGILKSPVEIDEVSSYWHLSAQDFAGETGTLFGWDLVREIFSGDMLSLATLVLMPVAIIICLVVMVFAFGRKRDWIFMAAVLLQTLVLSLAASGVISGN